MFKIKTNLRTMPIPGQWLRLINNNILPYIILIWIYPWVYFSQPFHSRENLNIAFIIVHCLLFIVNRSKFNFRMKEGYLKVHKVHLGIFNYQIDLKGFCLDLLMVSGSQLQVHTSTSNIWGILFKGKISVF